LAVDYRWTFAILAGGPNDDDDSDGWSGRDGFENGTNPLLSTSRPSQTLLPYPPVAALVQSPEMAGTAGAPVFLAQPPVSLVITNQ